MPGASERSIAVEAHFVTAGQLADLQGPDEPDINLRSDAACILTSCPC